MVNKKDTKILTEILGLDDVKVVSHRLHNGIGMILQTESKKSYSICPALWFNKPQITSKPSTYC